MSRINAAQRRQNCQRILESARPLFAESGFAATSVDDVARAASISIGQLYTCFASKKILIAASIDAAFEYFQRAAVEKIVDIEPQQWTRALVDSLTISSASGRSDISRMLVLAFAESHGNALVRASLDKFCSDFGRYLEQVCGLHYQGRKSPDDNAREAQLCLDMALGWAFRSTLRPPVEATAKALASNLARDAQPSAAAIQ